jgi:hypothetical protein
MDWKFWAPMIVSTVQLGIAILWFRKQLGQWNLQMAPAQVQEAKKMSRLGKYWPILAMFVFMVGAWTPYFFQTQDLTRAYKGCGASRTFRGNVASAWNFSRGATNYLVVQKHTSHSGCCIHQVGSHDADDVRLSKKALYTIFVNSSCPVIRRKLSASNSSLSFFSFAFWRVSRISNTSRAISEAIPSGVSSTDSGTEL